MGFLNSPQFPNLYSSDRNCSCSLTSPGDQVQLETIFFLLKKKNPCVDYVSVDVDGAIMRKCGYMAKKQTFVGSQIDVKFYSDAIDTDMGFWFAYKGELGLSVI